MLKRVTWLALLLSIFCVPIYSQYTPPHTTYKSSTATVTSVASSATVVTLLAANAERKGAAFFNDSTAILYIKFGSAASTSSYTIKVSAGAYYEVPTTIYTGIITGIWASANGNARITELI